MSIVLPHTFKDNVGENASGQQVDENFAALVAAVEGIAFAASGSDAYQAGVVKAEDWRSGLPPTIAGGTGVVKLTLEGGSAWLPDPAGGLTRTFQEVAEYVLPPTSLPGPGGFMAVGVEIAAAGTGAVVGTVAGAEQVSEALALANPAATSVGKVRVRDLIVENTAGVYSIVKDRDRRPWALGVSVVQHSGESFQRLTAGTNELIAGTFTRRRVEVGASGLIRVSLTVPEWRVTTSAKLSVVVDGVSTVIASANATGEYPVGTIAVPLSVGAGSHLIAWSHTAGGESFVVGPYASIVELRTSANNGAA